MFSTVKQYVYPNPDQYSEFRYVPHPEIEYGDCKLANRKLIVSCKEAKNGPYSYLKIEVQDSVVKEIIEGEFISQYEKTLNVWSVAYYPKTYSEQDILLKGLIDDGFRGQTEANAISSLFWHIMKNWDKLLVKDCYAERVLISGRIQNDKNHFFTFFPEYKATLDRMK